MPEFAVDIWTIEIRELLTALVAGTIISSVLAWHYLKYGRTMTNRSQAGYTIPIITLTIVLIISVVKSSIALSLGLVGALSIVRFRTPIKEPEELAYLFVAIGVGIGLGAGQTWPTMVASLIILIVMTARTLVWSQNHNSNLYVNVDLRGTGVADQVNFDKIEEILNPIVKILDLKRMDVGSDFFQATMYITCSKGSSASDAVEKLRGALPDTANVTLVDQGNASGS